jgi:cytoskeletal protein RodZ
MPGLGERFRDAREARGLTVSDVAEQIRIRSVYLAAIEEENWQSIGAPVYARGFLRTYARFLGLDPEEAVSEFNQRSGARMPPGTPPLPSSRHELPGATGYEPTVTQGSRSLLPFIYIASAVAVLLIAYVVYNALTYHQGAPLAAASPSPSRITSAVAVVVPTPAPRLNTLSLNVTAPTWMRVTVDGNVSIEGTFPAGTTKTFHGKTALVRLGNAGGVEITVDGKPVAPLGKMGDVVERSFAL